MSGRAIAPKGRQGVQTITVRKDTQWEKRIRSLPQFQALDTTARDEVEKILRLIKLIPIGTAKYHRTYYYQKLTTALTFPATAPAPTSSSSYGCSAENDQNNREEVEKALQAQVWSIWKPDESEVEVAKGSNFTRRLSREQNKYFYVDRSDPMNIRVKVQVLLIGKAPLDLSDIHKIKWLEHDIERACNGPGYWVDITFVDRSGPDVLEFLVDFCQWPNSGVWASGPLTLSHELHHALNLDDRYDYIESHADNPDMDIPNRIHWFLVQMQKGIVSSRDLYSKMNSDWMPLLSEDICNVAFDETDSGMKDCLDKRKKLDPPNIPARAP
jgi:hypothetical protein